MPSGISTSAVGSLSARRSVGRSTVLVWAEAVSAIAARAARARAASGAFFRDFMVILRR